MGKVATSSKLTFLGFCAAEVRHAFIGYDVGATYVDENYGWKYAILLEAAAEGLDKSCEVFIESSTIQSRSKEHSHLVAL
jgi:hypothetical protein